MALTALATAASLDASAAQIQAGFSTGDVKSTVDPEDQVGWVECDGKSYLITTYPILSAKIRGIYGGIDSTHFYVPNFKGKALIGAGVEAGLTTRTVGMEVASPIGAERVVLAKTELPATIGPVSISLDGYTDVGTDSGSQQSLTATGGTTTFPANIVNAGGGQSHQNMQPSAVVRWLIKT